MQNVFGGILMGCGVLIAGLSGLCVLFGLGTAFFDSSTANSSEMLTIVPAVLIAGGIPVAIGVGLFFGGRALMKSASPAPPAPAATPPEEITPATPPSDRTQP